MFRIQFSTGSTHRIRLPQKREKQGLITLAQAFVEKENSLPIAEQTPFTDSLQTTLAAAQAAYTGSIREEVDRKTASETLKRLDVEARTVVRQIRSLLAGRFAQTPELAQGWGFFVRQTGRGAGNILTPHGRDEIVACLNQYIATESARPAEEQFSQPPLAELMTLRDDLVQHRQLRDRAEHQRLSHNADLDELCLELAKQIRLGLGYLLLMQHEGELDRDLALWGFEVVAKSPTSRRTDEEAAEPLPEEEMEEVPESA